MMSIRKDHTSWFTTGQSGYQRYFEQTTTILVSRVSYPWSPCFSANTTSEGCIRFGFGRGGTISRLNNVSREIKDYKGGGPFNVVVLAIRLISSARHLLVSRLVSIISITCHALDHH